MLPSLRLERGDPLLLEWVDSSSTLARKAHFISQSLQIRFMSHTLLTSPAVRVDSKATVTVLAEIHRVISPCPSVRTVLPHFPGELGLTIFLSQMKKWSLPCWYKLLIGNICWRLRTWILEWDSLGSVLTLLLTNCFNSFDLFALPRP